MLAPQFIGFSALALLGRAGEMVRPYIIAKKERLTFTSQVAVWGWSASLTWARLPLCWR